MQKLLKNAQELFGLQLNHIQMQMIVTYERELMIWNEKINLTAIRDETGIRTKHFLDSLSCVQAWQNVPPKTLVDVGTGAGFPGLVLKILYPRLNLTLVESVGKKAKFCRHIVDTLHLDNVNVIQSRAETLGQQPRFRESFDWAVARAVARLPILSEYLLPLVKVGGVMLAQKGESAPAESQAAQNALRILGGEMRQMLPVTLPGVVEERYLVIVDKVGATPPKYPRREGTPAKKSL